MTSDGPPPNHQYLLNSLNEKTKNRGLGGSEIVNLMIHLTAVPEPIDSTANDFNRRDEERSHYIVGTADELGQDYCS